MLFLRENAPMKCPICGNRLARLADPCLHCASVLFGRAPGAMSSAPAATPPTSLTLPAELRVPDVSAAARPRPPVAFDEATPVSAPPSAAPAPAPAHATAPPIMSSSAPDTVAAAVPAAALTASAASTLGRVDKSPAIWRWAAAGVALLVLGAYLGVRPPAKSAMEAPAAPSVGASSDAAAIPVSAEPASTPGSPRVRDAAPATASPTRVPASAPGPAIPVTARPKAKASSIVKDAGATSPATPAPPQPVAAAPHPPSSRAAVDAAAPAVPEPALTDPREACGARGFIARALCINQRCAQAAFASHAECVKLRKAAEDAEQAQTRGG